LNFLHYNFKYGPLSPIYKYEKVKDEICITISDDIGIVGSIRSKPGGYFEDNSICIFPADLFAGNYTYYDSILDVVNQIYIPYDTMDITINKLTDSTMTIVGQCAATQLTARATKNYRFSLDSTSDKGQTYCTINDTISGAGIKQQFNDTIFKYNYTISNNDIIQEHKGYLFKK
jgi:hypothetical protein